jgi:hypothetical protein
VFIDETAVTTKMVRHYGRCPRGDRLVAKVPHGHWKTLTLVAALRIDGVTAPYVIDGAMDGATFLAYVEQVAAIKRGDDAIAELSVRHAIADSVAGGGGGILKSCARRRRHLRR